MADLNETGTWEPGIYQLETTDPVEGGEAGVSNLPLRQLANRTGYLKGLLDGFQQLLGGSEVTITNRGVIHGCDLSKSTGATRNLDIAAGRAFMHGRSVFVPGATNAASVPSNPGGGHVYVYAYLDQVGELAVTDIDQDPPEDALVLARLGIPGGNTDATDPLLTEVVITPTARVEPGWPVILTAPLTVRADFPSPAPGPVTVAYEVIEWSGAEPDVRTAARDADGIDIALLGSADNVTLRYFYLVVGGA